MRIKKVLWFLLLILLVCATTNAATTKPKEWTLAIYLNADNNLDSCGVEDQIEMSKVGSSDFLNIVSLIDRESGPATINYIEKDLVKPIKKLGEIDMGNYNEFIKFIKFIKTNYPAKHYAFVVWNHGTGWKNKEKTSVVKGISYDDSSGNHITNQQFAKSMVEIHKILGKKIDILCFDACLMQMVEVAYVCKDHCDYIVGSEETEPGNGAPYEDILSTLASKTEPREFAKMWVQKFENSYDGGSQGMDETTQSALDCSKFDSLVDAINGFAKTILSGKYERAINASVQKVQTFTSPENIDLLDFVKLLREQLKGDEAIKTACEKLEKAIDNVVIQNGRTGFTTEKANGIAIYLPWDYSFEPEYTGLAFSKQNLWDDMMYNLTIERTVNEISDEISSEKLDLLEKLVETSREKGDRRQMKAVIRELKFRLYTENNVPRTVKDKLIVLVDELNKVLNNS